MLNTPRFLDLGTGSSLGNRPQQLPKTNETPSRNERCVARDTDMRREAPAHTELINNTKSATHYRWNALSLIVRKTWRGNLRRAKSWRGKLHRAKSWRTGGRKGHARTPAGNCTVRNRGAHEILYLETASCGIVAKETAPCEIVTKETA